MLEIRLERDFAEEDFRAVRLNADPSAGRSDVGGEIDHVVIQTDTNLAVERDAIQRIPLAGGCSRSSVG